MASKSLSGVSPALSARIGRRFVLAAAVVLAMGSVVSLGVERIVSSRIDRTPLELMLVEMAGSSAGKDGRQMPAVGRATMPVAQPNVSPVDDAILSAPANVAVKKTKKVTSVVHAALQRGSATPVFDGRPIRRKRTMNMVVTGYSPDARSCGASADGITASGYSVWTNGMYMVAADTRMLPFGTLVSIPGYNNGLPVPVLDRGGAIKGRRLDLLFPTHEIARQWGRQSVEITVWEYTD